MGPGNSCKKGLDGQITQGFDVAGHYDDSDVNLPSLQGGRGHAGVPRRCRPTDRR
jgi:hypothetical protein